MNFVFRYNYIIAALFVVIYLAMPTTNFVGAATTLDLGLSSEATCTTTTTAPCNDCPCSDGQGSDCCDANFNTCACHAPLGQGLRFSYAPVVASQNFLELSWSLPQVYRTIFVPPQNPALDSTG
jgi:hypothetical protein